MRFRIHTALLLFVLPVFAACGGGDDLPDVGSDAYQKSVSAFYTGLAAIQSGFDGPGQEKLEEVTRLAPDEPASYANLGLVALRQNAYDVAAQRLQQAHDLAPNDSRITMLLGLLANNQGRTEEAVAYFRQALAQDSTNLKAGFMLAQTLEQQGGNAGEVRQILRDLLAIAPGNTALLLDLVRIAAREGDVEALRDVAATLEEQAANWPAEAVEQWEALQDAIEQGDTNAAATRVAFLRNVLLRDPSFRRDLSSVQTPIEQVAELITTFIRLPVPKAAIAPADDSLSFFVEPLTVPEGDWAWIGTFSLAGEGPPAVVVADGREARVDHAVTLDFPGGAAAVPPTLHGIAGLDYNYDFKTDLAMAGPGGLRLYRQDTSSAFTDVTAGMGLPASITNAAYVGVWEADLDMEGDIDLIVATPEGAPRILRNNGDGTFQTLDLFAGIQGLRDFAWADLDADGDPDAAMVDATGQLHVYENFRATRFEPYELPALPGPILAVSIADMDSDARFDLVALLADGSLHRLSKPETQGWMLERVADGAPPVAGAEPGEVLLATQDIDNNGGIDVLVGGAERPALWLSDQEGNLQALDALPRAHIFELEDLSNDGFLDLIGFQDGQPVRLTNQWTRPYHWKRLRPRAAQAQGDQRVNSFGIGGEIELRAGLLFQKQPIRGPEVHFGLGDSTVADVARIIWPNGDVQAEFDLLSDQVVSMQQRLKGSCPWLFTWDGEAMQFVTDFIWRSPLGLAINAQETAGVMMTVDWVKIRGDQLVPRDGVYDVRITAELWETHFFDHISLMAVDHPAETEVYIDERFAFPPPELKVHVTDPPRPVAKAWDDQGNDVTGLITAEDDRYLDFAGRGAYQGITREHYVEIELGEDVPEHSPLFLLAHGWIRPTDSSINVALAQGAQDPPKPLSLEVPDGQGGWTTVYENLGFPAGKEKTILIDLENVFPSGGPYRLRLRTNMEIFWDALAWTVARPEVETRTHRLDPTLAELRYRGFSEVTEANRSSPELPHYDTLRGTTPVWRDLAGYYTRFGDVRELLKEIDDRYVIMNAGDEMAFAFEALPPPPAGWTRDFVLVGDGWVKDGDYNTAYSTTVRPLPSHDDPAYDTPPGRLEDDPVYQRYPDDWQTYHTRYVTPRRFHNALRLHE